MALEFKKATVAELAQELKAIYRYMVCDNLFEDNVKIPEQRY